MCDAFNVWVPLQAPLWVRPSFSECECVSTHDERESNEETLIWCPFITCPLLWFTCRTLSFWRFSVHCITCITFKCQVSQQFTWSLCMTKRSNIMLLRRFLFGAYFVLQFIRNWIIAYYEIHCNAIQSMPKQRMLALSRTSCEWTLFILESDANNCQKCKKSDTKP